MSWSKREPEELPPRVGWNEFVLVSNPAHSSPSSKKLLSSNQTLRVGSVIVSLSSWLMYEIATSARFPLGLGSWIALKLSRWHSLAYRAVSEGFVLRKNGIDA